MKLYRCFLVAALLLPACASPYQSLEVAPDYATGKVYTAKVEITPDYMQRDKAFGGLPGGGWAHCGPVAVSNSLMWLAGHGYSRLAPSSGDRKKDQFQLIKTLSQPQYLNCVRGTSPARILQGVEAYVNGHGYRIKRLAYQGWQFVPYRFSSGRFKPRPGWMRRSIEGNSCVWLHVGFYVYDAQRDIYTRSSGHFVTMVGYGHTRQNPSCPYLIIHDPARRSGPGIAHEKAVLEPITGGELTGIYPGLPRSAAGYYRLGGEIRIHKKADVAILEGVMALELEAP
ncbi:MAG: hypothetical protein PVG03_15340 [Desulfarculaceae bacterium]